jgi:uncharacterized protein
MGRILVLAVLIVIGVWLIRRALLRSRWRDGQAQHPAREGELVRCARCGVHLPKAEARNAGGLEYCSEEHARLGPGSDA